MRKHTEISVRIASPAGKMSPWHRGHLKGFVLRCSKSVRSEPMGLEKEKAFSELMIVGQMKEDWKERFTACERVPFFEQWGRFEIYFPSLHSRFVTLRGGYRNDTFEPKSWRFTSRFVLRTVGAEPLCHTPQNRRKFCLFNLLNVVLFSPVLSRSKRFNSMH